MKYDICTFNVGKLDGNYQLPLHKELMEDPPSAIDLSFTPTSPESSAYSNDVASTKRQLIRLFSIVIMKYFYCIYKNN